MRIASLVIFVVGACAGSSTEPEHGRRYVTIDLHDRDAALAALGVDDAAGSGQPQVLEVGPAAAVIEASDDQLVRLAETLHERDGRCGGFMVHETLDEAREAAWTAAWDSGVAAVDYTLDQGEVVRAVLPTIDERRILGTIQDLSAMKNRYYQSESGAAASQWLAARWRGLSARPDVTVELFDHGYAQRSVILTIPGATRPEEVVVIGGHLDSIAPGGTESRAPGADDDASGIATLTEVARALLAGGVRPARTVQMIAYAAEEVGLRGSLGIVREYKRRGVNVVGALQLDMTNYQGSDRDIWIIDDHTSHAQNAFLVRLIEAYLDATWGTDRCGYACSDHASWNRAGVPASMPFESRFRQSNRRIHTAKDTLEASGENAAHAAKFARLAAAYAIELAKTAPVGEAATEVEARRDDPHDTQGLGALAAVLCLLLLLAAQRAWVESAR